MSTITFIARKANAIGEVPVSVRHTHNGSDTVKTAGVVVHPKYLDLKTGKVSKLPNAPELNTAIQLVATELATAARNLIGKGIEPVKSAMTAELAAMAALAELRRETAPQAKRVLHRYIDVLKAELAELKKQVELKKAEIQQEELSIGINNAVLVCACASQYANDIAGTRSANTVTSYEYAASQVARFNPTWEMKDVNADTLKAFVDHLIAADKRNLTINDIITKLKTVMYVNGKKLGLNIEEIKAFKTGVKRKRNPNVVFLTKNELQDLIDLELTKNHEIRIRDRFVLMALTGIRFSDSNISAENVNGSELLFSTEKTDTDLSIPISATVKEILDRYNNTFPKYDLASYNRTLKDICKRVESLQHKVTIKTYKGANKPTKTGKFKYSVVSAHVARKTFINLALASGVNPVQIASIVGHASTDLIMKTYGSQDAGRERIAEMMD